GKMGGGSPGPDEGNRQPPDSRLPTADTRRPDWDVLDVLLRLVDKSLVLMETGTGGEARYRLLETVRQYSLDKLLEAGEMEPTREAHRDWYLALAEQAETELQGPEQGQWLDRLEAEHDNLRAALQWSVEAEKRLRLASALWRFWYVRGHLQEGRGWLEG